MRGRGGFARRACDPLRAGRGPRPARPTARVVHLGPRRAVVLTRATSVVLRESTHDNPGIRLARSKLLNETLLMSFDMSSTYNADTMTAPPSSFTHPTTYCVTTASLAALCEAIWHGLQGRIVKQVTSEPCSEPILL